VDLAAQLVRAIEASRDQVNGSGLAHGMPGVVQLHVNLGTRQVIVLVPGQDAVRVLLDRAA